MYWRSKARGARDIVLYPVLVRLAIAFALDACGQQKRRRARRS
jgi:hypothetical protein